MINVFKSSFATYESEIVLVAFLIFILMIILFLITLHINISKISKGLLNQQDNINQFLIKTESSFVNSDKQQQHLLNQQFELKRFIEQQFAEFTHSMFRQVNEQTLAQQKSMNEFKEKIHGTLHQHQQQFFQNQLKAVDQLSEHLSKTALQSREEQAKSFTRLSEDIANKLNELTTSTDKRLKDISEQVEKRLSDGFDKTTKTFNDILKRLVLIDDAQKKITELSNNVVSLQDILNDKRSRGAFGEVQLTSLIRNVLPEQHFSLQHTLSNGKIADCILFLPEPTGNVVIDAKFPLESYKKMMDEAISSLDRKAAERQFKLDIKKHINDISDKYLIEKETAEGAIMFIPAEAIFAEIHAHQTDLVEYAHQKRVWLTSPTTLMAILTTSRSVLKDEATRKQIHVIQGHLGHLSQDFSRFKTRFANLAKHIDQAATDVKQIHTSADKISNRFEKIEQVDMLEDDSAT